MIGRVGSRPALTAVVCGIRVAGSQREERYELLQVMMFARAHSHSRTHGRGAGRGERLSAGCATIPSCIHDTNLCAEEGSQAQPLFV